jgi:hypothetical protein
MAKERKESEVSKKIKASIETLSMDEKIKEIDKLVESFKTNDPDKVGALLYFGKLWSEGGDPKKKEWERLNKDLRALELLVKRSGSNSMLETLITETKKELEPLDKIYG